ncbi:MAG: NTP transferase domain-containing protein [Bacteroidales bacterium]|nr:NTP transferase domain-containing protein [Bacteroidales bacterium]HOY38665.1 NTP transferase domain-containing protein [Bacteroidales bacterium]
MSDNFSTIILASGMSGRMGEPKALLRWDSSFTFLEKIVDVFVRAGSSNIVCVVNKAAEPYCIGLKLPSCVSIATNNHPEWDRFYSVKTGIQHVKDTDYCFIHNVDNPFITPEIVKEIFASRMPGAWCSPVFEGKGGHPVLLSKTIYSRITNKMPDETKLKDFLFPFPRIIVETDSDCILRNINTPDDYKRLVAQQ